MNDSERDAIYTHLCATMTDLGEASAPLFLARLAWLAIERIGNAEAARELIDVACANLPEPRETAA